MKLLPRLTWGHFRRHRLEGLLCLAGVALGVAVVVAIDSAVKASVESFGGAVSALAERSTHSIFAISGPLSDEQYIALVREKPPYPLAPVIDRNVLAGGEMARLMGIDLFSERGLRSITKDQAGFDAEARQKFLTEPGAVVLADELARRLGVGVGKPLELITGGRRVEAHVVGIFRPSGVAASQLNDLILADLATAQEMTDSIGQIDRVDTRLENDADEAALARMLPSGLVLRSTRQQAESLENLTASYRLNLMALSLMASFVAVFIVYNSMLVSVRQRTVSLGILRCLGASRRQMAGLYVMEAVAFGVTGELWGYSQGGVWRGRWSGMCRRRSTICMRRCGRGR